MLNRSGSIKKIMHNINIKSPVKSNVHARAAPAVGGSHRRQERFP